MSGIDSKIPHSEDGLPEVLRKLAHSAPDGASPELGPMLAQAFHRHHARRRLLRATSIVAASLVVFVGLIWIRTGFPTRTSARRAPITTVHSNREQAIAAHVDSTSGAPPKHLSTATARRPHPQVSANKSVAKGLFVVLPAFALSTPDEELRVIRVEMPISSLRLLGAHVNDELFTRRVTADLLVGPDGTPYAFRLIT